MVVAPTVAPMEIPIPIVSLFFGARMDFATRLTDSVIAWEGFMGKSARLIACATSGLVTKEMADAALERLWSREHQTW